MARWFGGLLNLGLTHNPGMDLTTPSRHAGWQGAPDTSGACDAPGAVGAGTLYAYRDGAGSRRAGRPPRLAPSARRDGRQGLLVIPQPFAGPQPTRRANRRGSIPTPQEITLDVISAARYYSS